MGIVGQEIDNGDLGARKSTDADKWVHIFWDNGTDFRSQFDQLDLTCAVQLGCGVGAHAAKAAALAEYLMVFDVSAEKLARCKERLKNQKNVAYVSATARNFQPIGDAAVTAIYSYDEMVLYDAEAVGAYLRDAHRVLALNGLALLHHSNNNSDPESPFRTMLHGRQFMTQAKFTELALAANMKIVYSRTRQWGGVAELDCLTLLQKV